MKTKIDLSQKLMKAVGIITKKKANGFTISIPANIWDQAEKEFNFSFNMLKVGGDLSLAELAEHMDMQSANEATFGSLAEIVRYQKELMDIDFETWYSSKFYLAKNKLPTGKNTDKAVHAYILKKWPEEYKDKKRVLCDLEFKYRLLNNAIFSAVVTKGKMLQSLRNILQGNNQYGLNVDKVSSSSIIA